jgi:hypothetical protein
LSHRRGHVLSRGNIEWIREIVFGPDRSGNSEHGRKIPTAWATVDAVVVERSVQSVPRHSDVVAREYWCVAIFEIRTGVYP